MMIMTVYRNDDDDDDDNNSNNNDNNNKTGGHSNVFSLGLYTCILRRPQDLQYRGQENNDHDNNNSNNNNNNNNNNENWTWKFNVTRRETPSSWLKYLSSDASVDISCPRYSCS